LPVVVKPGPHLAQAGVKLASAEGHWGIVTQWFFAHFIALPSSQLYIFRPGYRIYTKKCAKRVRPAIHRPNILQWGGGGGGSVNFFKIYILKNLKQVSGSYLRPTLRHPPKYFSVDKLFSWECPFNVRKIIYELLCRKVFYFSTFSWWISFIHHRFIFCNLLNSSYHCFSRGANISKMMFLKLLQYYHFLILFDAANLYSRNRIE
jgi:hypothetical protein